MIRMGMRRLFIVSVLLVTTLVGAACSRTSQSLEDAAQAGNLKLVSTLLDRRWGAPDVNAGALRLAASQGHTEVVALLIDAGADVNQGTRPSKIDGMIRGSLITVFESISTGSPTTSNTDKFKTPTHSSHPAALFSAIENGHTEVAGLLIKAGSNVNAMYRRQNAVSLAELGGRADMIELLKQAARLPTDHNLIDAAQSSDWERMSTVIEQGAEVNAQSSDGWTALMYTTKAGEVNLVSRLLERGAEANASTDTGETALLMAASRSDNAIASLLLDALGDVKAKSLVNARDDNGWTALMYAAQEGESELVATMLNRGADVNAQTYKMNFAGEIGETSLYKAARQGYEAVIRQLLDAGANVNTKTQYGWSPLFVAEKYGHMGIAEILRTAGAKE